MRPIDVVDVDHTTTRCYDWQFKFNTSQYFSKAIERAACKLLNELLYEILALNNNVKAHEVTRAMAQKICDEMEQEGIRTTHGAIIHCYKQCYKILSQIKDHP